MLFANNSRARSTFDCRFGFHHGGLDAAVDIEASLRVMWHLINEVGVPMFKAARSNATRATGRTARGGRQAGGDPFAAAAALLGSAK